MFMPSGSRQHIRQVFLSLVQLFYTISFPRKEYKRIINLQFAKTTLVYIIDQVIYCLLHSGVSLLHDSTSSAICLVSGI